MKNLFKRIKALLLKKNIIAVINFKGIISSKKGNISIEAYNGLLEKVFELPKLKAVVLNINSPGGSPSQSELIYKKILRLKKEKKVKVFSFVEEVAASGGYYIAAASDEIIAANNTIIGSIGVISAGFGLNEAIEKLGIKRRVYTSGKSKSILDPFLPEKQEDIEIVKEMQSDIYENFVSVVKESRNGKLTENDDIIFSGRIWSGFSAKKIGLVDRIDDLDNFIESEYGKKVKIVRFDSKKKGLLSKLGFGEFSLRNMLEDFWW